MWESYLVAPDNMAEPKLHHGWLCLIKQHKNSPSKWIWVMIYVSFLLQCHSHRLFGVLTVSWSSTFHSASRSLFCLCWLISRFCANWLDLLVLCRQQMHFIMFTCCYCDKLKWLMLASYVYGICCVFVLVHFKLAYIFNRRERIPWFSWGSSS